MKRYSTIVCCILAGVLGCVIAQAALVLCASNTASAESRRDAQPSPQPPTRETIPDDVPPKVRQLMEGTFSGDIICRVEAILNVKRMGQGATPLIPYLINNLGSEQSVTVGRVASAALYDLGEVAVEPMIAALGVEKYKGEVRELLLFKLGLIGDRRAVPALIAALKDDDGDTRATAAWALSKIPDQRSVEPLMQCLRDKNERVVSKAIRALGKIGDRRAVEAIIPFLTKKRELNQDGFRDPDGIRRATAVALGDLGDRRAFEPLLAVYEDKEYPTKKSSDWGLRNDALTALGQTKDPRAFDILQPALNKNRKIDDWERIAAVWGLAGLGDDRSIALLKRVLTDERPTDAPANKWWKTGQMPRVRPDAARALVGTGDDSAIDAVYQEYKASPEIVNDEIERGILDSIRDSHFRVAAVDALAMSPKPRAYLKVIDILEGDDASMREETARVLYCSTISQRLSPIDIAEYERRKLPALDDIRVLKALMKVAESSPPSKQINKKTLQRFWRTQDYAVSALKKSGNPEALRFVEGLERKTNMVVPFQGNFPTGVKEKETPSNSDQ